MIIHRIYVSLQLEFKQNGKRNVDARGINRGWNEAEFYWPVLMTQKNMNSAVYTIDNK